MTPIPKILTGLLETEDIKIEKLKNSILRSFDDKEGLRAIAAQQCENRAQTNCYSCGNEGSCLFLNGILHFKLGEIQTAINEFEIANQHFRGEDDVWNSIIGQAMLGSAHEANEIDHLALREYQQALDRLIKDYLHVHSTEYIEKAAILKNLLYDQMEYCSLKKKNKQPSNSTKNNARLIMPWMPKYSGLRAGTNGPVWTEPLLKGNSALVDRVILEDNLHDICPIKRGDNLITLTSNKKYRWARVSGNSMNASKPIPILENDYVLFYDSTDANNNAIVIAACADETGAGYRYMVKRYYKNDRLLISETEPPALYDPIPINKNVKIIGVVVAIAKPAKSIEEDDDQSGEVGGDSQASEDRYNELVSLVRGDIHAAERLIAYEESLSPQSSRNECIEKAIARLLHDRRA